MNTRKCLEMLVSPAEDLTSRCVLARSIYWRYSFDFDDDESAFETGVAHDFCAAGGIAVLCYLALVGCSPVDPPFEYFPYVFGKFAGTGDESDKHSGTTRMKVDSRPRQNNPDCLTLSVDRLVTQLDSPVRLPPHAFSHDSWQPLGAARVEHVSLRRLAVEILSEMSNYLVYRREMGRFVNVTYGLVKLLHRTVETCFSLGEVDGCVTASNNLFMVDRLVNLMANLSFDLDRSVLSLDRLTFNIYPDSAAAYQLLDCRCDPATNTLPNFFLCHASAPVLRVSKVTHCVQLLRTCARFMANTCLIVNARILYRLTMSEPVATVSRLIEALHRPVSQQESVHQDFVRNSGLRASNTALLHLTDAYHRLHKWHWTQLSFDHEMI